MSRPHTPEKASEATGLIANADAQSASPLFTIFPPEIRAEIFALALCSFSDTSNPYPFNSYWYRPGYTAPKRTEVSLLLACRRIYEEVRELIWKDGNGNDEQAFWWGSNDRRPQEYGGWSYVNVRNDEYDDYDSDGAWTVDSGDGSDDEPDEEPDEESEEDDLEDESGQDVVGEGFTHQQESDIHLLEEQGPAVVSMEGARDGALRSNAEINQDPRERHIKEFLRHSLTDVTRRVSNSPFQSNRQLKFTSAHWSRIRSIHIFPQMWAFLSRAFVRTFIQAKGLRPRTVKVTIRYTDWWYWEANYPLQLSSIVPERDAYYFPESVDTLIIELESAEHKKTELEDMVKEVLHDKEVWRWKRLDDEYLELDEGMGVKEWEWMGTTRFKDQPVRLPHHPEGDAMKYIVKVLTFTAKPTHVEWDGTPFDRALAIKSYEASLKPS